MEAGTAGSSASVPAGKGLHVTARSLTHETLRFWSASRSARHLFCSSQQMPRHVSRQAFEKPPPRPTAQPGQLSANTSQHEAAPPLISKASPNSPFSPLPTIQRWAVAARVGSSTRRGGDCDEDATGDARPWERTGDLACRRANRRRQGLAEKRQGCLGRQRRQTRHQQVRDA